MSNIINNMLVTPGKWFTEFDENGNVTKSWRDAAFLTLLGFNSEEEYSKALNTWSDRIHPDDIDRVLKYRSDFMSYHTDQSDYDIEYRLMTKSGYRWVHDSGHCSRREDGTIFRCDGTIFSIQEIKDYEIEQEHESLRKEVLDYIINHDEDPIELLKVFAERIRVLIDCDQVIYRDLKETRIMVNSPAIEKTWAVPFEYCQQCQHLDPHHPMYAGGYTEMDNCQEGWQGIPVFHKCPIKSSLTRIVYCNGEIAGYLAIHYVQKYHHFTDLERKTLEDFTSNLSLTLSRYEGKKVAEQKANLEEALTFTNFFLDTYNSAYYINLDKLWFKVFKCPDLLKDKIMQASGYLEPLSNFFKQNVHPDDLDQLLDIIQPERVKEILSQVNEYDYTFRDYYYEKERIIRLQLIRGTDENHAAIGFKDITEEANEQKRRVAEAEASRALIENLTSFYNIVYSINLNDDSFTLLRMDDNILGYGESFDNFSQAKAFFLENALHPIDREWMRNELDFKTIRKKLLTSKSYSTEYRAIINGVSIWHEMNVTSLGKDEVAICFATKDTEIIKRHLEEKRYDEFFALFEADLDTEMIKAIKNEQAYDVLAVGNAIQYTQFIQDLAHDLGDEPKTFFLQIAELDFIKKELAAEDKLTYSYKSSHLPGNKWIDVIIDVIQRHADGTPGIFTIGFSIVDTLASVRQELQKRLTSDMQLIGGLASGYHALYFFNIDENFFTVYSLDGKRLPEAAKIVEKGGDPMRVFHEFGMSSLVHPDDKHLFAELSVKTVRERLAHSKKFSVRFRRRFGDKFFWTEMDVVKFEDIDEQANAISVGFAERDAEIRAEKEQQQQLHDNLATIKALADDYGSVYYVDIESGKFTIYSMDDSTREKMISIFNENGLYEEAFKQYIENFVYEPDREMMFREFTLDSINRKP